MKLRFIGAIVALTLGLGVVQTAAAPERADADIRISASALATFKAELTYYRNGLSAHRYWSYWSPRIPHVDALFERYSTGWAGSSYAQQLTYYRQRWHSYAINRQYASAIGVLNKVIG